MYQGIDFEELVPGECSIARVRVQCDSVAYFFLFIFFLYIFNMLHIVPGERSIARIGVQCRIVVRGVLDVGTTHAHSSCQDVAAVALAGRPCNLTGLNFLVVAVVVGWANAFIGIVAEASAAAPQLLLHFSGFLNHRVALVAHELVLVPPFVEGRPTLPRHPHCYGIHDRCIRRLFDKDGNVTGYVVLGFNVC